MVTTRSLRIITAWIFMVYLSVQPSQCNHKSIYLVEARSLTVTLASRQGLKSKALTTRNSIFHPTSQPKSANWVLPAFTNGTSMDHCMKFLHHVWAVS